MSSQIEWPLNHLILRYLRESEGSRSLHILGSLYWFLPSPLNKDLEILPRYQKALELHSAGNLDPQRKDFFEEQAQRIRYEVLFEIKFIMWNPKGGPWLKPTEDQLKEQQENILKARNLDKVFIYVPEK